MHINIYQDLVRIRFLSLEYIGIYIIHIYIYLYLKLRNTACYLLLRKAFRPQHTGTAPPCCTAQWRCSLPRDGREKNTSDSFPGFGTHAPTVLAACLEHPLSFNSSEATPGPWTAVLHRQHCPHSARPAPRAPPTIANGPNSCC